MKNKSKSDGRVVLNRDSLIELRRGQGISQELLAMLCAERRLSVSIASVKRAETGKNILYRTARDLAAFFDADLNSLIATIDDGGGSSNESSAHSGLWISERREIITLICELRGRHGPVTETMQSCWKSVSELCAVQSDVECVMLEENLLAFLFGRQTLMGYEAPQAAHFALRLSRRLKDLLAQEALLVNTIRALPWEPDDSGPNQAPPLELLKLAAAKSKHIAAAGEHLLLLEQSLESELQQDFVLSRYDEKAEHDRLWILSAATTEKKSSAAFIGRELQQQQFKSAIESVLAYNELALVYIRGMAGIGKTSLMEACCQYARRLGFLCIQLQVLDFGQEQQQEVLPRLVRALLQLAPQQELRDEQALLRQCDGLPCAEADLLFLYVWLGRALSAKQQSLYNAMSYEAREAGRQRVIHDLARHAAAQSPLMLCIEDLHWADPNLLNSIAQLGDAVRDLPVMLLLTSRKEQDPLQQHWASAWIDQTLLLMDLAPLRAGEAKALAEQFEQVPSAYREQCITLSEGNPLFLQQLLHMLSYEQDAPLGQIPTGNEADRRAQNITPVSPANTQPKAMWLPRSLQALVQSRLDNLSPLYRSITRAASVLGQSFSTDALEFLIQRQAPDLSPLISAYLLKAVGDRFQFVHALVHQGVYQSITQDARQILHQRCALWFEQRDLALYARHLHKADNPRAPCAYADAVRQEIQNCHFNAALKLIKEALSISAPGADAAALYQIRLMHAEALMAKGATLEAVAAYRQALQSAPEDRARCAPLTGLANGLNTLDEFEQAMAALDQSQAIAKVFDLNLELARIHNLRGNFYFPSGNADLCVEQQQAALHYAQKANSAEMQARALGGLGDATYAQGKMNRAFNYFNECLQLCRQHDLGQVEAANRFMIGTTRIYRNETSQALRDALDSAELAASVGHRRAEIVSRLTAGWILLDQLRFDQARQQTEQGLELARSIGARRFEPFLEESIARNALLRGELEQARLSIEQACQEVRTQHSETFIGPWLMSTAAWIAALRGDVSDCKSWLEKGEALLRAGCVGHNYFRFYTHAMEAALVTKNWPLLHHFSQALKKFTAAEPNAWSEFYLARATLLADYHRFDKKSATGQQSQQIKSALSALKTQAEQAQLNSAISAIEAAIAADS